MKTISLFYSSFYLLTSLIIGFVFLSGCASGQFEKQKKERDKLSSQSGFYCDFINSESSVAAELELNVHLAKKCDSEKTFSFINYKHPNEQRGLLYCCVLANHDEQNKTRKRSRTKKPDINQILQSPPSQSSSIDANKLDESKNNEQKNDKNIESPKPKTKPVQPSKKRTPKKD